MKAPKPPSGALWLHEIKHDGFRVIARKEDARGDKGAKWQGAPTSG